ncbi:hypothetical protein D3C80_1418310 [compost metagenome]
MPVRGQPVDVMQQGPDIVLDLPLCRGRRQRPCPSFHRIEGLDIGFFPFRRFLAGEPHAQEGEAVAGHAEGLDFAGFSETDLHLDVHARKIAGMELGRTIELSDSS